MFHSIRWRIAIPFVLLILVILAVFGGYLVSYVRQTYLDALQDKLVIEARLVSDQMGALVAANASPEEMDSLARRWAAILDGRVTLIGADGTVLGESHETRAEMDNHADRIELQRAMRDGQGSSIRYSLTVGYDMMYTAVVAQVDGAKVGAARVALPLSEIQANVNHIQRTLLGTTLLAALLVAAVAILIAEHTTRPLRELTEAARGLSAGELTRVSTASTRDEVGVLARSFNSMAAQLHGQIQALTAERGKLSAVLEQMTDGVVIVDQEGLVQLLNPTTGRMFGVQERHALNHSLTEVLRHHEIVELWQRCRETNEIQEINLELGLKRLSIQGVAIPLGKALPGSTLLLFQDVTRLRQLETVRRDFVSNISHELRTPLASLKALAETLQDSITDDPPAARRFVQHMETEVDSLSLMVSELLELVRIESGRAPLQFKSTSPHEILSSAAERLRLQAERASLDLSIDCPDDLPAVLADPLRIEQVVVNLLHNAIKFTPQGGKISLAAHLAQNGGSGPNILFSVEDSGVGISADDLPRIFERFYKADRARSGGGTGLGLAIARHLVEAHGGKIWAESIENKGSTFYFNLPVFSGK
jgi:two-component system phosphate regulon sensor histidine kinase PhoR